MLILSTYQQMTNQQQKSVHQLKAIYSVLKALATKQVTPLPHFVNRL